MMISFRFPHQSWWTWGGFLTFLMNPNALSSLGGLQAYRKLNTNNYDVFVPLMLRNFDEFSTSSRKIGLAIVIETCGLNPPVIRYITVQKGIFSSKYTVV